MPEALYPLLFEFVYKDYVWGGTRIPQVFARPPQEGICAESWEISVRPEGMSTVSNGRLAGRSLDSIVAEYGPSLLGSECTSNVFPLLIKVIDSKQRLSLQVHPNERTAPVTGGEPKTEMWHVLDAEPGAKVFSGLAPGIGREQFAEGLARQELEPMLQPVPVEKGSTIFIPGGRLHAIGAGCLLLEVQQNSNTTYRVYDWGRLGTDGKPRELHVKQALQTINWDDAAPAPQAGQTLWTRGDNSCMELVACPFFHVNRIALGEPLQLDTGQRSFHALFVAEGNVAIEGGGREQLLESGRSCLVPAAVTPYSLTPAGDPASLIHISLV